MHNTVHPSKSVVDIFMVLKTVFDNRSIRLLRLVSYYLNVRRNGTLIESSSLQKVIITERRITCDDIIPN